MVTIVSPNDLGASHQRFLPHPKQNIEKISAIGNLDILRQKKLALFCSARCPGSLIIQAYDCMKVLRDAGITVISGFHSPVEKECLKILLRGKQPIIVCPARGLENMRIKPEFKKPLEDGRLLFLSPFQKNENRISAQRSAMRNYFIAAVADAGSSSPMRLGRYIGGTFQGYPGLSFKKLTCMCLKMNIIDTLHRPE